MSKQNQEYNSIHPKYYGKVVSDYELIDYIVSKDSAFARLIALKYILRAGKKDISPKKEDLLKALYYLQYEPNDSPEVIIKAFENDSELFKMNKNELIEYIHKLL